MRNQVTWFVRKILVKIKKSSVKKPKNTKKYKSQILNDLTELLKRAEIGLLNNDQACLFGLFPQIREKREEAWPKLSQKMKDKTSNVLGKIDDFLNPKSFKSFKVF
jgi:hypothetical protein